MPREPSVAEVFARLCELLSLPVLQEKAVFPFLLIREAYVPENLAPRSRDEMMAEVSRYLEFDSRRFYDLADDVKDPSHWRYVSDFMEKLFGKFPEDERAAFRIVELQGMRRLLEILSEALLDRRLKTHIGIRVMPLVWELGTRNYHARLALAERYLESFRDLPGLDLPDPVFLIDRFEEIFLDHARVVIGQKR